MAWQTVASTDITARLSGRELTLLQSVALADGQSDPLPEVILQVVDEIRGYISAHKANTLGAGSTIPQVLLGTCASLVRYYLAARIPSFPTDETRKEEYRQAIRRLEQVAEGKFAIEEPANASTENIAGGGGIEVNSPNTRQHTRAKLNGL